MAEGSSLSVDPVLIASRRVTVEKSRSMRQAPVICVNLPLPQQTRNCVMDCYLHSVLLLIRSPNVSGRILAQQCQS